MAASFVTRWRLAVRDDAELHHSAKLVALTLATYMNAKGRAWPSKSTLAAGCGRSARLIDRGIDELERTGYLVVERSRGRYANRYRAALPAHERFSPCRSDTFGVSSSLTSSCAKPDGVSPRSLTGLRESRNEVNPVSVRGVAEVDP